MLLLAGADPTLGDHRGNTVLHLASQLGGQGGMVAFLLQYKEIRGLLEQPNTAGKHTHTLTQMYHWTGVTGCVLLSFPW